MNTLKIQIAVSESIEQFIFEDYTFKTTRQFMDVHYWYKYAKIYQVIRVEASDNLEQYNKRFGLLKVVYHDLEMPICE
jgi:hypothetical protein